MISGKKRLWKPLKQILTQEMTDNSTTEGSKSNYGSIDAPPSFKPAKKYSDISGLEANYTDPHTKLNYFNVVEFKVIKKLPSDLVAGYLTLRRANIQLQ
jgi:INO80 complex subunit C